MLKPNKLKICHDDKSRKIVRCGRVSMKLYGRKTSFRKDYSNLEDLKKHGIANFTKLD